MNRTTPTVAHVSSFRRGGAATAAQRLHRSLRKLGVRSHFLAGPPATVADEPSTESSMTGETPASPFAALESRDDRTIAKRVDDYVRFRLHRQRFKRAARGGPNQTDLFSSPIAATTSGWSGGVPKAIDIVQLHWIAKHLHQPRLLESLRNIPVVWTLHDMNAFTGGCHYSGGCERFQTGCGHCPQLRSPAESDVSRQLISIKDAGLRRLDLHVVAPSRWLLDAARSSHLFRHAQSFHHIPYAMELGKPDPEQTRSLRQHERVGEDEAIIIFGAMDLDSPRKGGRELFAALEALTRRPLQRRFRLWTFGAGDPASKLPEGVSHRHFGMVTDAARLRTIYSAGDVFVLPSLEDNLPLTGIEAMAAGTPVIGFRAGGIPDYVVDGHTGWLANAGSSESLADRIGAVIDDPKITREMGDNARRKAEQDYACPREATRYCELYDDILASRVGDASRRSARLAPRAA